ncbi:hypothetical protein E2C01_086034 [Portunus trituberculatus]|uniref:Uncharacterized protein n=1 Tax=Portunus trituberculatus TaxID=210409 RepID=A0A5B7JF93_PORTR|nr:hypothetical protein [Portunus trituberculatus]
MPLCRKVNVEENGTLYSTKEERNRRRGQTEKTKDPQISCPASQPRWSALALFSPRMLTCYKSH